MNYLQVDNISKAFGDRDLFSNVSFGIEKGQKAALIARNGAGKSTLMNIISGADTPDEGKVVFRKHIRISYLPQNPAFKSNQTILDTLFSSDSDVVKAFRDYELALENVRLNPGVNSDKLLEEHLHRMDQFNAWNLETKAHEILGKFKILDLTQPVDELSGGQRKKVALAHALLDNPDFLLLDEPTNYLDFEMIEWLEDYLSNDSLSLLLVTHDRYFLDNVCDTILELDKNTIFTYKGNYSYFLEKKAERQDVENVTVEKARNLYRTELEWVRRMPKARGTKSKARLEAFEDLKEKVNYTSQDKVIRFDVRSKPLGGKILEINNIAKKFGEFSVIDDFSYIFKRGEKIGILGLNGTGKTTLLNMISGRLNPDHGRIVTGQTVVMSYFTQEGLQPVQDKRVIDIVKDVAEEIMLQKGSVSAAQFLYHFNFGYTTQQAYFSSLSGGEKRRLFLLLQLMRNPNFLLLDEPTNDLDIYTLQVLEEFLLDFPGCLLVVSHDRFLLDKLCDHVFVFEGEGKIRDFYGSYTDYYQWKVKENRKLQKLKSAAVKEPVEQNEKVRKASGKPSYKQKKALEHLEEEIALLESEMKAVLERLNSGQESAESLGGLSRKYGELEELIEQKTQQWIELNEAME